jgi:site-specific recombinase XerD
MRLRPQGKAATFWPHTFTTRFLEKVADLATVQQLLGHSTVVVTMRYAHPNLDSKRQPYRNSKILVTV